MSGLHRALLVRQQAVADGEGAGLVEADRLVAHACASADLRGDDAEVAQDAFGDRPGAALLALARQHAVDQRVVEIEEGQRLERAGQRLRRTRACSEPRVIERPPRPAITVCTASGEPEKDAETLFDDDAADADGEALLEHDDALRARERLAHRRERPRPEAA